MATETTAAPEDDGLAHGSWEPWLAERFVAYLLNDAEGRPRPVADVESALARLSGDPGALSRLGALAFLLDPDSQVRRWLTQTLPAYLRRLRVRSERVLDVRRGAARSAIDWPRTMALRAASFDETWTATRSYRRTTDTVELLTVRCALARIAAATAAVLRRDRPRRDGWTAEVAALGGLATGATSHTIFRDVPLRTPDRHERALARSSGQDPAVREAARILDVHDELLPVPRGDRLRDALARHALVPLVDDVRFQLFAMLAVVDCVDRVIGSADRRDALVRSGRDEVVTWRAEGFALALHYDQVAESGRHLDVMRHYFGRVQPLRPDLRLVLRRGDQVRELLLDAKRSTQSSYLAEAHHKMHGYVADRPEAFIGSSPKAVVVCPANDVAHPRPGDDVVFVGVSCSAAGGSLEQAIRMWFTGSVG